ncbi:MAG: hypothetical protein WC421_03815 [Elusimicrobiales bacterium]
MICSGAPRAVYRRLLDFFGPQGWWPVTEKGAARPGYHPGDYSAGGGAARFEMALGAILTQNTAWANAERALENLNRAGVRTPGRLLKTPPARLRALIRPSGYFAQKEKKLRLFCRHLAAKPGSDMAAWLGGGAAAALREELLSLWGIGPETADSILLYAGEKKVFVVDAYTLRTGGRLGWFGPDAGYARAQEFLEASLPRSARVYNEFHALLVALGKNYCRKKPRCGGCPLYDKNGKSETAS